MYVLSWLVLERASNRLRRNACDVHWSLHFSISKNRTIRGNRGSRLARWARWAR
jgi:hypothetical protein